MSSSTYATPLTLELRPSRWLLGGLLMLHVISIAVLWLPMMVPWWLRPLLLLMVLWSAWHSIRLHAWQLAPTAMVRAVWREQDWVVELADGTQQDAQLLPGAYVTPALVVLGFQLAGQRRRRYLLLAPDSADITTLRRLRVRLRLM